MRLPLSSRLLFVCLCLCLCLLSFAFRTEADTSYQAAAVLRGGARAAAVEGTIKFQQPGGPGTNTSIQLTIKGLPIGDYALHIHQYGDISSDVLPAIIGGHFNPANAPHGCYPDTNRHVGDIGNVTITQTDDWTNITYIRDLIDLGGTVNSIVARSVIIHSAGDKCDQPTGNAGTPIIQGVIGIVNTGAGDINLAAQVLSTAPTSAIAVLNGTAGHTDVYGTVQFQQTLSGRVRVVATVNGLAPNSVHGFHIHTFGDLSAADGTSASLHYNPYNKPHGPPTTAERHVGDMGNITADANGVARLDREFDLLSLTGTNNILGRAVIVHGSFDDGVTANTGNAGARYAIGVIGISNQALPLPAVTYRAGALIRGGSRAPNVEGMITVDQTGGPSTPVTINVQIRGLAVGDYALHIHQYGDISSDVAPAVIGGHFNPANAPHGCYPDTNRHVGDIGNITITQTNDWTNITYIRDLIDLSTTSSSVIGRTFIIHSAGDKCDQPTGNAGTPIIQGVIGILSPPAGIASNGANLMLTSAPTSAIAVLRGTVGHSEVTGTVMFGNEADGVRVVATVNGLAPNSVHGFHIHTYGDVFSTDATSAGGHYNPYSKPHGPPTTPNRHVGDMGNITADANGVARLDRVFDLIALTGTNNIIGRAVIVHGSFDDGVTVNTGNAGARYAIGVIGVSSQSMPAPIPPTASSSTAGTSFSSTAGWSSTGGNLNGGSSTLPSVLLVLLSMLVAVIAA